MRIFAGPVRRGAARGFTLVELLIALSLVGILSLLLVDGLWLAARAWDAVEQRTTTTHQEYLALDFLQRQLESAQPLRLSFDAEQKGVSFVGGPRALRFVAPLPGHLGAGGMYWFSVELVDAEEGKRLVLTYELFQRAQWERFGSPEGVQVVLLESLKDAQFAYLGPGRSESPAEWTTVWEPQARLPRLIRVRFSGGSAGDGRWQEFLAAPKLAGY